MAEFIQHFGLDVRLLIAQAVNFALLFFVLKRFAFDPLLLTLTKRRKDIEKGIAMREDAERELRETDILRDETMGTARKKALELITAAEGEARERQEHIVQEAVKKSTAVVDEAKRLVRQERMRMTEDAARDMSEIVRLGIERVIGKIPSRERDQELIHEALAEARSAINKK